MSGADSVSKGLLQPEFRRSDVSVSQNALWMVVLTIFFDMMADSILSPVLGPYAKMNFNASALQVGLLFSFPCASAFLSSGFLSIVMDRIGRRPMFIVGCLGLSLGALCQAVAPNYWVLLAGRTFSGIWMCLVTTACVYINESTAGVMRSEWQGKMSAFQAAGALFGPGLGGGLSQYGLNVPSFATAFIEFIAAFLGYLYLEESPSFMMRTGRTQADVDQESSANGPLEMPETADNGRDVCFFYLASTFTQSHQKLTQAIFPLFAIEKYGLRALDIGFVFLASAAGTMATSWFVVRPLATSLGPYRAGALACAIQAGATLLIPFFPHSSGSTATDPLFITMVLCFVAAQAATNLAMSFEGAVSGSIGDPADQAKIQAGALRSRMAGKVVAPIVGACLLRQNILYPWLLGALVALSAAPFCFLLEQKSKRNQRQLGGQHSAYGTEWRDEVGSRQDIVELGEIMAELLTRKHFKWVSNKEEVQKYLERAIPELPVHSRDVYYEALMQPRRMTSYENPAE